MPNLSEDTGKAGKTSFQNLSDAGQALHQCRQLLMAAIEANSVALEAIDETLNCGLNGPLNDHLNCDVPVTTHRKNHRPGKLPKIDGGPELRAFVLARLDRLSFPQIAAEVAANFPPDRRVSKSSIHLWWQRNHKQDGPG